MEAINFLGIDWGEKRIGLSLGNNQIKIAHPFKTVANLEEVLKVIQEEEIEEIVLGQPLPLADNSQCLNEKWMKWYKKLEQNFAGLIHLEDERLSSLRADQLGKDGSHFSRDELAATVILQNYFDSL